MNIFICSKYKNIFFYYNKKDIFYYIYYLFINMNYNNN